MEIGGTDECARRVGMVSMFPVCGCIYGVGVDLFRTDSRASAPTRRSRPLRDGRTADWETRADVAAVRWSSAADGRPSASRKRQRRWRPGRAAR